MLLGGAIWAVFLFRRLSKEESANLQLRSNLYREQAKLDSRLREISGRSPPPVF
jgi:hypothetical protein